MSAQAKGRGPAHFSESWILGFYFNEVSPRLDRRLVWPKLVEKGNRLEDEPCPRCRRADTFTYQDSQVLMCAHANSCGARESVLEKLAGCARPSGERLLDAVKEAARLANVLFPTRDITPEEKEQARSLAQRQAALEVAYAWAASQFWSEEPGAPEARAYMKSRGFTDEALRDLQIGYWPNTTSLRAALATEKLGKAAEDASLLRGNLTGYVIFPWRDSHGGPLTVYGRWPGKDLPLKSDHPGRWGDPEKPNVPKTFALPGTGSKHDPLYFDRVKRARHREVVLVEGVIDAALAQACGDTRVCAYVAGSLAGGQVDTIAGYQPASVTICPDPDEGGDKGVRSSLRRLSETGLRVYVAPRLPGGQDPDEFIKDHGIGAWRSFLDQALPGPVFLVAADLADMNPTLPLKLREEKLRGVVDVLAGLDGEGASLDKTTIINAAAKALGFAKNQIHAEVAKRRKTERQEPKARPALREVHKGGPDEAWRGKLMWTETQTGSTLTRNLANAVIILSNHPDWRGVLAFNEFSQKPVAVSPPPSHGKGFEPKSYPHTWGDHDDALAAVWLQRGDPVLDVSVETAARAVQVVAQLRRVHPVRDYLDGLVWDGAARLDSWLATYTGAAPLDTGADYLREVGSKWMIAAVARIYEPGCKVDTVLVLEGAQGIRKSTAFKTLGGSWFTDDLADVGSKDAAVQLQGAWIIELAELDALSKAESAKVKSFFTRRVERYVPKYARHSIEVPRQCVFCGTVNPDTYLKDETGNRRFWPVRCGSRIDVDGLARDRDQLWAEAVARYKAGEPWHLDSMLEQQARSEQEARFQADAWEDVIAGYLSGRARASVQKILSDALSLSKSDWGQSEQNRVARCLKRLGWERKRVRLRADELHEMGISGQTTGLAWVYVPSTREPGEEG